MQGKKDRDFYTSEDRKRKSESQINDSSKRQRRNEERPSRDERQNHHSSSQHSDNKWQSRGHSHRSKPRHKSRKKKRQRRNSNSRHGDKETRSGHKKGECSSTDCSRTMIKNRVVSYKYGDLFTCPENESLAHCVSADMKMGKGIAVFFKEMFGSVNELLAQNQQPGGCAILNIRGRFIFYLVTKKRFNYKPTAETLKSSLLKMHSLCKKHGVKKVSMPQIGAGLDRLNWNVVKSILEEIFVDSGIEIDVYIYKPNSSGKPKKK